MGDRLVSVRFIARLMLSLSLGFSSGALPMGSWSGQGAIAEITVAPATFPVLEQWQFQPETQTLEFQASGLAQPSYFTLQAPSRVVIDVKGMSWEQGSIQRSYRGQITQIRVAEFRPGITRFVLESANPEARLNGDRFQLRSMPGDNKQTLWQLSLGQSVIPTVSQPDPETNINKSAGYPPALLPPVIRESVTVPPPPIPSNLQE